LIDIQAIGYSRWEISENLGHCGGRVDNKRVVEAVIEAKLDQGGVIRL
jgi:hypothetical protein